MTLTPGAQGLLEVAMLILVAIVGWRATRVGNLAQRITTLDGRVADLERKYDAAVDDKNTLYAYSHSLRDHIYRGNPPPPPLWPDLRG